MRGRRIKLMKSVIDKMTNNAYRVLKYMYSCQIELPDGTKYIPLSQAEMDDIDLNAKVAENYLLKQEDILIARSGIPGVIRILEGDIENTFYCGFIIRLNLKSHQYRKYLVYKLKDYENTTATTSGGTIMQNVSQSTLRDIRFAIPTEKYISAFSEKINSIWLAMKSRTKENRELISLRDFLLPLRMNGQVGFRN